MKKFIIIVLSFLGLVFLVRLLNGLDVFTFEEVTVFFETNNIDFLDNYEPMIVALDSLKAAFDGLRIPSYDSGNAFLDFFNGVGAFFTALWNLITSLVYILQAAFECAGYFLEDLIAVLRFVVVLLVK